MLTVESKIIEKKTDIPLFKKTTNKKTAISFLTLKCDPLGLKPIVSIFVFISMSQFVLLKSANILNHKFCKLAYYLLMWKYKTFFWIFISTRPIDQVLLFIYIRMVVFIYRNLLKILFLINDLVGIWILKNLFHQYLNHQLKYFSSKFKENILT